MRYCLAIIALIGSVNAQIIFQGNTIVKGNFSTVGSGSSAPLYLARTDDCAVGSVLNPLELGCGSAVNANLLNFQMRPGDVIPFTAPLANSGTCPITTTGFFNTGATDPDFSSHLVMVTDPCTKNLNTTFNMGEDNNDTDDFSYDSSMFLVGANGSGPYLYYLNATYIRANPCLASDPTWNGSGSPTQCLTASLIKGGLIGAGCASNCTIIDNQGIQSWSRVSTEPYILYELQGNGIVLNQLSICRYGHPTDPACGTGSPATTPDHFRRLAYANFADPVYGIVQAANSCTGGSGAGYTSTWTGELGISDDGSVTLAEGGGNDWCASTAYVTPDSFIYPFANSTGCSTPGHCHGFQATNNGTSGTTMSATFWIDCATGGSSYGCSEATFGNGGTVVWHDIGKVTGQGPGYELFNYRPASAIVLGASSAGYSRLNTRVLKVYRGHNEGPSFPLAGFSDPTGTVTTDDGVMCLQFGLGPATGSPPTCPTPITFSETFTLHGAGTLPNSTYVPMTPTGSGGNPPAQSYSPGTQASGGMTGTSVVTGLTAQNYRGGWVSLTSYIKNDAVYDSADGAPFPMYVALNNVSSSTHPSGDATNWAPNGNSKGPVYSYKYVWTVPTTTLRPCLNRGSTVGGGTNNQAQCSGHEVHGNVNEYGDTLLVTHLWQYLTVPAAGTYTGNLGAVANPPPGTQLLYTNGGNGIPGDQHGTYRDAGTTDVNPIGSANTDVPTGTYSFAATGPILSAGYGEFVGIQTNGSGSQSPCTSAGTNCFFRFAHSFNDGLENDFSAQNNIAVISQDGQWAVVGTDMMGSRGSRSSDWATTHSYAIGTPIFPLLNNSGSFDYVAYLVSGSGAPCSSGSGATCVVSVGTSGGSEPKWQMSCNPSCTDGQITWQRQAGACNNYNNHVSYNGVTYSTVARYSPTPVPTQTLNVGDVMFPVDSNPGSNVFMVPPGGSGTVSGAAPNWNNTCGTYGQSCAWGPVTFVNVGASDCRADILLIDLVSAH